MSTEKTVTRETKTETNNPPPERETKTTTTTKTETKVEPERHVTEETTIIEEDCLEGEELYF